MINFGNTYSPVSATPIKIRTFPSSYPKTFLLAFCSHHPSPLPQATSGMVSVTIKSYLYCIWLLSFSIMLLRFIQATAYINNSFLFIAKEYSITCIHHILYTHQQTKERQSNPSPLAPVLPSLKASLTRAHQSSFLLCEVPRCANWECSCDLYNLVTKTLNLPLSYKT